MIKMIFVLLRALVGIFCTIYAFVIVSRVLDGHYDPMKAVVTLLFFIFCFQKR